MFYVYILESKKDNSLYIGSTNNMQRRLKEHNNGEGGYTKKHMPYELVYFEAYKTESDARKREHNLKLRSNAFNQTKKRLVESLKTD